MFIIAHQTTKKIVNEINGMRNHAKWSDVSCWETIKAGFKSIEVIMCDYNRMDR